MKKLLGGSLVLLIGILAGMGIMAAFSEPETVEVVKYVTEKEFVEVSVPLSEIVPGLKEDNIQIRVYDGNLQVRINNRWKNFGTLEELSKSDPLASEKTEAITKLEEIMTEKKAQAEKESGKSEAKADYTSPVFGSNAKKGEVKKETVKQPDTSTTQPADNGNSGVSSGGNSGTAAGGSSGGSTGSSSGGSSGGNPGGGAGDSGAGASNGGGNDNGGNAGGGNDNAGNAGGGSNGGDTDAEWSGDLE